MNVETVILFGWWILQGRLTFWGEPPLLVSIMRQQVNTVK